MGDNGMDYAPLFEPPPEGHQFTDPIYLKEFILSGKAVFTLYSQKSSKHITFKVKAKGAFMHWVSYLTSNGVYEYLGTITDQGFTSTRATRPQLTYGYRFKAFDWFWKHMVAGQMPKDATVHHEGMCGACGRPLTDPVSIKTGYGPDCREKKFKRPAISDKV